MDTNVSARFFRVSPHVPQAADFPDLLLGQMSKTLSDREYDVTETGIFLRLEECKQDKDFVFGEFCRKQTTNIPPQAGPDGLKPIGLASGQGLGHLAAFRYHKPTRVILLQGNPQCATAHRIGLYLMRINAAALYTFTPVLREDALERLKDHKVRSFTVQFASPKHLEALDDRNIATAKGAKMLADAFHGFKMTITVSVGKRKKKFLDYLRVNQDISALLASDAEIKKLNVVTDDDEGDPIDFLKELLKAKATLPLPEEDHPKNYGMREAFLKSEFNTHIGYIMKHFGPKP
jgi:hypothetical protein